MIGAKTKAIIIANLRRLFLFSNSRRQAKKRAEFAGLFGVYVCEGCDSVIVTEKVQSKSLDKLYAIIEANPDIKFYFEHKVDVDHKYGVVTRDDPEWHKTVISKMFCEADDLQILCQPCHYIKTQMEK